MIIASGGKWVFLVSSHSRLWGQTGWHGKGAKLFLLSLSLFFLRVKKNTLLSRSSRARQSNLRASSFQKKNLGASTAGFVKFDLIDRARQPLMYYA